MQLVARVLIFVAFSQISASEHTLRVQTSQNEGVADTKSFATTKSGLSSKPTGDTDTTIPTLRQWLSQKSYTVGIGPMMGAQLVLISMMDVLETHGAAGKQVNGIMGSSTGGLIASAWATRQSKYSTEYARLLGKKIRDDHCATNCSMTALAYVKSLDLPPMGYKPEYLADCSPSTALSMAMPKVPFKTKPMKKDAVLLWSQYMLEQERMGLPQRFDQLNIPLVVSAFGARHKNVGTTYLMNKGNLPMAVLASCSTHHHAGQVAIGGSEEHPIKAGDGYPGDPFGALGFDVLVADERVPSTKGQKFLNLIPIDSPKQAQVPMNWTELHRHDLVGETATIYLNFGNLLLYAMSGDTEKPGIPVVKLRNYIWATHDGLTEALDKPMSVFTGSDQVAESKKNNIVSYKTEVEMLQFLGLKKYEESLQDVIGKKAGDRGPNWYAAVLEGTTQHEAVDVDHMFQNHRILAMKKCMARATRQ